MVDEQLEKLTKLAQEQREQKFQCENCVWFADALDKTAAGECRRYPPTQRPASPMSQVWLWPKVHFNSVCGEFMHRKTGRKFTRDALEEVTARVAALEEEIRRCSRDAR